MGLDDTGDPALFPEVGFSTGSGDCTATLISPSHLLTAAHCVATNGAHDVDFAARNPGDGRTRFDVAEC